MQGIVEFRWNQFGFMFMTSIMENMFALRKQTKKCRAIQRDLFRAVINLIKAYNRDPRKVNWECLRNKCILEEYIRIGKEIYRGLGIKE